MKKITIILVSGILIGSAVPSMGTLEQDFKNPPNDAKPWVYWWFEGGYGNPEGMAKDIAEEG